MSKDKHPAPVPHLRVTDLHVEAAKLALVKHSVLMPTDAAIRDMLAAAASLNVPPATNVPPVADLIERAFEIGFCWRSQLIGQTLEDSRAVGRTLESYIFEGLNVYLDHFNSFESSDAGIVEAKKRIIAALRSQTPPPQTRKAGTDDRA